MTTLPSRLESRVKSIDLLRGLLMLLMAIDHARDYFYGGPRIDPTDPAAASVALYFTRWITHLCAPGFVALVGTSVYLQLQRGKSRAAVTRQLAVRGLWLILLEVTIVDYVWSFCFSPALQVIWTIGVSMLFLAALLRLSTVAIGIIGAAIVALHNLLDPIQASSFGSASIVWKLLHQQAPILFHDQMIGFVLYPLVPWIGVICLGYAFGPVTALPPARRLRLAVALGAVFLGLLSVLRIFHLYGDRMPLQPYPTAVQTLMAFFRVSKYPPSLHYLLATLGFLLLLYALFDLAATRKWLSPVRRFIETYGRVPFFYYILHIYLLHGVALILTAARGLDWHFWLQPGAVFFDHLDGWGYSLPVVYLVCLVAILVLYLPCRWFSQVKARRRDWWLSYL